ncbi:MAG: hypothetical protein H7X95_13280, partial [Deltaproteobacteria bacterium]|nr:hypothetical protein [Deltaproteobacteria bacterium]
MPGFGSVCMGVMLWVAAGPAKFAPEVRGDTACPTAGEVRAALSGMVSPSASVASDVVELTGQGSQV